MTTTVTRDPEVLPVHPGNHHFPWQAQPSFFAAIEVDIVTEDGVRTITNRDIEEMLSTDRTHRGFMNSLRFDVEIDREGPGIPMAWHEWLDWQKFRNPLNEQPEKAKEVREQIAEERRGPGIAKRPRPAARKKAAPKKQS